MRSDKEHMYVPQDNEFELFRFVTTCSEAAKHYGYHIRTIRQWCDEGRIAAQLSEGTWLISIASIDHFLIKRE